MVCIVCMNLDAWIGYTLRQTEHGSMVAMDWLGCAVVVESGAGATDEAMLSSPPRISNQQILECLQALKMRQYLFTLTAENHFSEITETVPSCMVQ